MSGQGYNTSPWPRLRDTVVNACDNARPHTVYGASEIDFTEPHRRILELRKRTRVALSVHSYVLWCVARVAVKFPMLHAMRQGNRLITFDTIDMGTIIDQHASDVLRTRLPVIHIVREADRRSLASVNWEIRTAARTDLGQNPDIAYRRRLTRYPKPVQRVIFRRILRDPILHRRFFGTMGFTSTQSPGYDHPLHAFVTNLQTATVAMGNLHPRFLPDAEGKPVLRKVLSVSGAFDHDFVDGMLLSKFGYETSRFIESAEGLDDDYVRETRELARTEAG